MGEIADMMLDGTLCEGCGVFLGDESSDTGFPQLCASCADDRAKAGREIRETGFGTWQDCGEGGRVARPKKPEKIRCTICKKWVKKIGLGQHKKDAHGVFPGA